MQCKCHLICRKQSVSIYFKLCEFGAKNMSTPETTGLNDIYKDIAEEIGFENAIAMYNMFKGMQVSFPCRLLSTDYTHELIRKEYLGTNIPQLAQKYNYSERTIRRIVKDCTSKSE